MRIPTKYLGPAVFLAAAALSVLTAIGAASLVEFSSAKGVRRALDSAGYSWAEVGTDGLQVVLTGTAPTEAARFRALSMAGSVVDAGRIVDAMEVQAAFAPNNTEFKVEVLRNDDGVSVIGLIPASADRGAIVEKLRNLAGAGSVTDMLESADHPVPQGWGKALSFGLDALRSLPRSKISIAADSVSVTAITDSAAEKARLENSLRRTKPEGVTLNLDISAPRPVITPFTLRFIVDAEGPRFDACSAQNERARDRIVAAAAAAGAKDRVTCTIGLGVPSPEWAAATEMGIAAAATLGDATITFSDADVALVAGPTVKQADFDRVVGELESNLPEVFSLKSVLTPAPDAQGGAAEPDFTARLAANGKVQLRGRLADELARTAVENYAKVRFGGQAVYGATRLDSSLPQGWSMRVLVALEALAELEEGTVSVTPTALKISGKTGSNDTAGTVARILSDKLGEAETLDIDVRYDPALDPTLGLPTPEECVRDINAALTKAKVNFDPGSAHIAEGGDATLDVIAERMKDCAEVPMEVGGHTDSQGREEMNLSLSQDRAQAIIAALMSRRVLTGNLTAQGYGETQPIADNDTEDGREANRRIEFRLLAPASDTTGELPEDAEADAPEAGLTPQLPNDKTVRPKPRVLPSGGKK